MKVESCGGSDGLRRGLTRKALSLLDDPSVVHPQSIAGQFPQIKTGSGEVLLPYLLRPLVPPLGVAPRTWDGQEFYGPRRYTRGEARPFAGPDQGRRNDRHVERRGHGGFGDRRR